MDEKNKPSPDPSSQPPSGALDSTTPGGPGQEAQSEARPAKSRPWDVFQYRDYTLLWLGGTTMQVAFQLRNLAASVWIFEKTGNPADLGILGIFQLLPIPITLFGGALADTMDRKKLMVTTQVVSLASLVIMTVLLATGDLVPWHIWVLTGITGTVNALGQSARPAMVARVVPRSHISNAVTMNTSTMQVGGIGAPVLFGLLYSTFGPTTTFAVASGLTLASVVTPMMMKVSGAPDGGGRRLSVQTVVQGWGFVLKHPILPGLYLLDIGVTVVSFYRELFPIFTAQLYGCDTASGECARQVGWLGSVNAVGALAGSLIVFFTNRFQRKGLLVIIASALYAVLLFAFGLNTVFLLGLLIVVGLGMTDAVTMTMRQAIVQLTTPDSMLGRASAAHSFAAMGANQLGKIEVSFMSAAVGAGATMVIGGVVAVGVVGVIWALMPGVRRYRYVESQPYGGDGKGGPPSPATEPRAEQAPAPARA